MLLLTLLAATLEDGMNYLPMILTFIAGGGLTSIVSVKFIKQQAKADAFKSVQDVYQETIKDLREDKERMKEEMSDLRSTCEQNSRDIASLKEQKCGRKDCVNRI